MSAVAVLRSVSPRSIAVALVAAAVAVAAAGWFVVVAPKRSEARVLDEDIAYTQTLIQQRRGELQPTAASPEAVKGVRVAVPDDPSVPAIVDQLARLAASSEVTLISITPAQSTAQGQYVALPLNVVVTGRYFAIEQFLRQAREQVGVRSGELTANGRLFSIQQVDLQQTEPAPEVQANLTLQAFFFTSGATG